MTPEELVILPDAERERAIQDASSLVLWPALEIAKRKGSAYAAADIAFELGRRDESGEPWEE